MALRHNGAAGVSSRKVMSKSKLALLTCLGCLALSVFLRPAAFVSGASCRAAPQRRLKVVLSGLPKGIEKASGDMSSREAAKQMYGSHIHLAVANVAARRGVVRGEILKILQTPGVFEVRKVPQDFNMLASVFEAAGLEEELNGPGPYTVFAPDDEAFEKYLAESGQTLDELLASPDLERLAKHHLASGTVKRKAFSPQPLVTLADTTLKVETGMKGLRLDGVQVKQVDVLPDEGNALFHVMKGVMVPQ
eukprot:TRINITY_DN76740_c0_g1_i1.p1 TRINITY_DN76740_c0_g1~~TRINITY_DN76740_c0_g1_i1.p1  ORF type:complete len:270 (-),score=58.33 TRINITY_DN76740_c0_g1_i1:34-780(-)